MGVPGCDPLPAITYAGDFDGDGQDEILRVTWNGIMNVYQKNGSNWDCLWGNGGDSAAGNGIYPYRNNLVVGDFDGDGKDEVLGTGGWITMFHFDGGDWHWGWSNYGSPTAGNGIYPYRNNLQAGDFDGDGKDEVLGGGGWITMFHFDNGDWHWGWSNYGSTSAGNGIYPYRNHLSPGDFDGDGKTEMLGTGGWITMFHFDGGTWHWGWSNYGSTSAGNGIYPYRNEFTVGDYDGDTKDEILGTGGWITMFHFDSGTWHWGWSNSGNTSAGNGIYPYRHVLHPGDFDGDGRTEVLGTTSWNTVFAYESDHNWHWNWSDSGNPFLFLFCN